MNDKELADKIVALGVGVDAPALERSDLYRIEHSILLAGQFVRDPHVAMALLNKVYDAYATLGMINFEAMEAPLERPIIQACVKVLHE